MSKFSDLLVRGLAALIGATVIIFCTVYNQWTFFSLFLIITVLCIREYNRLVSLPNALGIWLYIIGGATYSLLFLNAVNILPYKFLAVLIPSFSIGLIIQLYQKDETPLRSMALLYLGIGYVVVPFSLLGYIGFHLAEFNPYLVLAMFFMIWCMDTGAYFTGISIGKHKLFKRISPKKSWEGAIGGFVLAVVAAWVFSLYLDDLTQPQWLVAGALVAVAGIFGDLVESFIKRVAATKDSGTSIPGHGGFLDRFDSLIFSIPFYLLLLKML